MGGIQRLDASKNRSRMSRGSKPDKTKGDEESKKGQKKKYT